MERHSTPTILQLSRDAFSFLFKHQNLATKITWVSIAPVFYLYIPIHVIIYLAFINDYVNDFLYNVLSAVLCSLYVLSVVSGTLSWHRMIILGPNEDHIVKPFKMSFKESKAVAYASIYFFLPALLYWITRYSVMMFIDKDISLDLLELITIPIQALYLVFVFQMLRGIFVWPSLASGHGLSFLQAKTLSKGLMLKLIFVIFSLGALFFISLCIAALPLAGAYYAPSIIILASLGAVFLLLNSLLVSSFIFIFTGIISALYLWARSRQEYLEQDSDRT